MTKLAETKLAELAENKFAEVAELAEHKLAELRPARRRRRTRARMRIILGTLLAVTVVAFIARRRAANRHAQEMPVPDAFGQAVTEERSTLAHREPLATPGA
jgi:hypothetical protein